MASPRRFRGKDAGIGGRAERDGGLYLFFRLIVHAAIEDMSEWFLRTLMLDMSDRTSLRDGVALVLQ